jgi:AraC family transcriptional regulator, transcriptional activator of pobA
LPENFDFFNSVSRDHQDMIKKNDIPIRYITETRDEPDFSESFCIQDIRELLAGKDLVQELHRLDCFLMLAVKRGTGHHEIDFTLYEVCDNSLFFMRPGQVHQLGLKAGSTGYLLQFTRNFYYPDDKASVQLLRRASQKSLYQPDAGTIKKVFVVLTCIFQEYSEKQEGYQEVIQATLGILLIELVRQYQDTKIPMTAGTLYPHERMEELSALLEENITTHKQVSHYAAMMNLSAYQINRLTKTMFGKKCSELIAEYIILESKRYLLGTSGQINLIASQLGYDDVSYFIRFFKKHTGSSPEAYRHNFR